MNLEIERKYLLKNFPAQRSFVPTMQIFIDQHYIPVDNGWERIRKSFSTLKSKYEFVHCQKKMVKSNPTVYEEDERLLSEKEYDEYLKKATKVIRKKRYVVPFGKLKWEIDVYENIHLMVAEIELPSVDYIVELPNFISENLVMEVTDMLEFTNEKLALPV